MGFLGPIRQPWGYFWLLNIRKFQDRIFIISREWTQAQELGKLPLGPRKAGRILRGGA